MSLPILRETADVVRLFDPATGEELDLAEAPVATLAELRDAIRAGEEDQRIAKQALDAELHRRMDFENTLTLRIDGWVITGKPADAVEWDVPALKAALEQLVAADVISEDAARRALEPTVVLKPRAGELKKLSTKPAVAGVFASCRRVVPQPRRATVKRAGESGA